MKHIILALFVSASITLAASAQAGTPAYAVCEAKSRISAVTSNGVSACAPFIYSLKQRINMLQYDLDQEFLRAKKAGTCPDYARINHDRRAASNLNYARLIANTKMPVKDSKGNVRSVACIKPNFIFSGEQLLAPSK